MFNESKSVDKELWESIYPKIRKLVTKKIIIVSTSNGMNQFYNIWKEFLKSKERKIDEI